MISLSGGRYQKRSFLDLAVASINPQYFVVVKQPTLAKVILRKAGTKKYKGWKIGLTVSRYEAHEERKV